MNIDLEYIRIKNITGHVFAVLTYDCFCINWWNAVALTVPNCYWMPHKGIKLYLKIKFHKLIMCIIAFPCVSSVFLSNVTYPVILHKQFWLFLILCADLGWKLLLINSSGGVYYSKQHSPTSLIFVKLFRMRTPQTTNYQGAVLLT